MPNTAPDPALQQERRRLAQDVLARLQQLDGDGLVVGGLSGSVARGEATPFSDIDLLLFTADHSQLHSRTYLVEDVTVALGVIPVSDLQALLRQPDLRWPKRMGLLAAYEPLIGETSAPARWLAEGQQLDAAAFRAAVLPHLPELVYESYGRIESCLLRDNRDDLHNAALETVYEVTTAICLINRRWVTRDYFGGIRQSFDFALQPRDWPRLAVELWQGGAAADVAAAARQLLVAYEHFLAAHDYAVERHPSAATLQIAAPLPAQA